MSFSRVVEVQRDATLDQVARALGFSARSALVHAFERWTGPGLRTT